MKECCGKKRHTLFCPDCGQRMQEGCDPRIAQLFVYIQKNIDRQKVFIKKWKERKVEEGMSEEEFEVKQFCGNARNQMKKWEGMYEALTRLVDQAK